MSEDHNAARELSRSDGGVREPADDEALLRQAWGALNFIMAFYEPGQRYLDTEAWKQAEAGGHLAHAALSARLGNSPLKWGLSATLKAPTPAKDPTNV